MAGPGLLAYVATSKYADYLPLYRLEAIFERNGLQIDRATQSVWCGDVADLIHLSTATNRISAVVRYVIGWQMRAEKSIAF
jgi:transposase